MWRLTFLALFAICDLTACSLLTVTKAVPSSPYVQEIDYNSMLSMVAKSTVPVFIEEYDPGFCDSGCRRQHAVVNDLAAQYFGKVRFFRVITSEAEFKSGTYPVYYIAKPPLQVFDQASGIQTEDQLKTFIDDAFAAMYPSPKPTNSEPPGQINAAKPGGNQPVIIHRSPHH